jgi:hypothetical protein
VDRSYHYIRNGDGREELYDLQNDRGETHDLARAAVAGAMLQHFRALHGRTARASRVPGTVFPVTLPQSAFILRR